ncbi:MAG: MBL fold metallo-hydrolase [Planctomycetota bacterium]
MLRIGSYDVVAAPSGTFGLDGGAMFGVVPRPLWERSHPPDERNRIALAMRLLVLRSPERTWLVDVGIGDKFDRKHEDIYRVDALSADEAVRAAGVDPGTVTDVVLTHLHFDHAGGATRRDGSPAFPGARYHVQRRQLEWARHATAKDRGSFREADFLPLYRDGRLNLLDGPGALAGGIEVVVCDGHTSGMQLVKVGDGERTLLYVADLVPTAAHLRLPYVMAYDNNPLQTLKEKQRILSQAAEEGWILFLEHDPSCAACRVEQRRGGFTKGPEVQLT